MCALSCAARDTGSTLRLILLLVLLLLLSGSSAKLLHLPLIHLAQLRALQLLSPPLIPSTFDCKNEQSACTYNYACTPLLYFCDRRSYNLCASPAATTLRVGSLSNLAVRHYTSAIAAATTLRVRSLSNLAVRYYTTATLLQLLLPTGLYLLRDLLRLQRSDDSFTFNLQYYDS